MNLTHFAALIRLRYTLTFNQVKKAGKLNLILSIIALVAALACSISAFFIGLVGGAVWFQNASTTSILVTWNIIVAAFIVMWMISLLVELQQTELMSIDKLLHLPISLRGAFVLNYASSFINTTFLMFTPLMIGLSLGLVFARGLPMLISLPLVIGFLFFVTTLTYQLRGWLARIMENKRTRGTVIAVVTIFFILLTQIPNLINMNYHGSRKQRRAQRQAQLDRIQAEGDLEIDLRIKAGEIDASENGYWKEQLEEQSADRLNEIKRVERKELFGHAFNVVEQVDTYVPLGWLPLGIVRADQGKWIPGILGVISLFTIGLISLSFSYRTSMRKYTGRENRKTNRKKVSLPSKEDHFLFRRLPWVSEHASAIAVASMRSLMRAPESKMSLIFPLIMAMLGSSFLLSKRDFVVPDFIVPWIPIVPIGMTMFGITSLLFNQFGMDRDGFRAYVLSPIERRDILLGKNLALAPLAIGICVTLIVVVQVFVPQGFFWLLGSILQVPTVFLLFCGLGNTISIFFPMGIKRGSMQPANPRFVPILIMFAGTIFGPMFLLIPTILSCAVSTTIQSVSGVPMGWLYLILSIIQLVVTYQLYRWLLNCQDRWLWKREPKILEVVANIPE